MTRHDLPATTGPAPTAERTDPAPAPLHPSRDVPREPASDATPAAALRSHDPADHAGRRDDPSSPRDPRLDVLARTLRDRMGPERYDRWFAHARFDLTDGRIAIDAESPFVARWINSNFAGELRGVTDDVIGPETSISVSCDRPAPAPAASPAIAPPVTAEPAPATSRRRSTSFRRLEEFVIGASNQLAFAAAHRLVNDPEAHEISPLFIHGECGVGKTHLLQGICRDVMARGARPSAVRYVTGEQFTNEYVTAVRNDELDRFRARVRRLDLLAIDDVHFLSNKTRTQSEFLHTLDSIGLTGSRVVLASDEHPHHIKRFSQALVSRFLSGMVVCIERPDRTTRQAIVRQLAARRNLAISVPAVDAIAARCAGSVRELEGALTTLAALHDLSGTGREISLATVDTLFRDAAMTTPVPIRLGTIIDEVTARLRVARTDVMGSTRQRRVVLARALIAFLARDLTNHSFPEIGRAMGRTYHSTMHTASRRLQTQLDEDVTVDLADEPAVSLRDLVDELRHAIRGATARRPATS